MAELDRVEVRGLVKTFGATRALGGVDLICAAGSVTVVEGPNGSGKSTLLTLIAQLGQPTRGSIRYGARSAQAWGSALRQEVGLVAHASMLCPDLTVRENLDLFADLYGAPRVRVQIVIERFALGGFADRPVRTLSRGQAQRTSLARAVVHGPSLLLLDEPSTGLDADSVSRLVTLITEERGRGVIVIAVTHDSLLAEKVADQRLRLERGRVAS